MQRLLIPLNKSASIFYTIIPSLLLCYLFPKIIINLYHQNNQGWIVVSLFEFILLSIMLWLVPKRLIPALKGTTALELNENFLYYYPDDNKVEWKDIKSVELKTIKSSFIAIQVNNPIIGSVGIPLQWISGSNDEIYEIVNQYWEKYKELAAE